MMRLLLGASAGVFFLAMLWLVIRECRYEDHVPVTTLRRRWPTLPVLEHEGHRKRFDGDKTRHQMARKA
jgi:hypothetical protein